MINFNTKIQTSRSGFHFDTLFLFRPGQGTRFSILQFVCEIYFYLQFQKSFYCQQWNLRCGNNWHCVTHSPGWERRLQGCFSNTPAAFDTNKTILSCKPGHLRTDFFFVNQFYSPVGCFVDRSHDESVNVRIKNTFKTDNKITIAIQLLAEYMVFRSYSSKSLIGFTSLGTDGIMSGKCFHTS